MFRLALLIFLSYIPLHFAAQIIPDSAQSQSGLAKYLLLGPFNCPSPQQKIKFPAQFYKESRKKEILVIENGKIQREVSCISKKKEAEFYENPKHFCEWWFALQFIPRQCDKWKRAYSTGADTAFKNSLYRKIAGTKNIGPVYIPDLSLHYFYFDQDKTPDLIAYDCTDGNSAKTFFMLPATDSVVLIDSIKGYAQDVRFNGKQFTIITNPRDPEVPYTIRNVYIYDIKEGKLVANDFFTIISQRGLKLPLYTSDKSFSLSSSARVGMKDEGEDEMGEVFLKNAKGYILAEESDYLFVAMTNNNETATKIFSDLVRKKLKLNPSRLYTIGWIRKTN